MEKQIIISYEEYKRLERKVQEYNQLVSELISCVDLDKKPSQINVTKLKKIALNFLPEALKNEDFIDV